MTLRPISCVVVVCDDCGSLLEAEYVVHFDAKGDDTLDSYVRDMDWETVGEQHFCDNCRPDCECGHAFGAHDRWQNDERPCEESWLGPDGSAQGCACPKFAPVVRAKSQNSER